ncbi:NAD(P)-binding protein [Aureobasidium subglaciale]|nr:NAD(P)-binding protein [Aureobasidium subglaciale]
MAPTILIVGATGNTGKKVAETLPSLIKNTNSLADHRILCLTRSSSSEAAKKLAKFPGVELAEQNWVEIDAAWLQEHNVERIFIASHNEPNQFAEESQFYVNCLLANVKYVVRISTTGVNVKPDFLAYYPRQHWAIEQLLGSQEFTNLAWTSLPPNGFLPMFLWPAADFIKNYRKTGEQGSLGMMVDSDTPTALIDSDDVGRVAAHLLAQQDVTPHNNKKYILNGPEDITGNEIVQLVEEHIGTKVEKDKVAFKDVSGIDYMASESNQSKNIILSIKNAPTTMWAGKCKAETTSKEILDLYAPKRTAAEVLKELVQE